MKHLPKKLPRHTNNRGSPAFDIGSLPTCAQATVLSVVANREIPGHELRQTLRETFGIDRSLGSFYQLMRRLEDRGDVVGTNSKRIVEGHAVTQRSYSITREGHSSLQLMKDFLSLVTSVQPEKSRSRSNSPLA